MHILMDFIAGGDTMEKVCRTVTLHIRQVQMYCRQLLHALEFLHRYRIVHRDIKGANVLLSVEGVIKLSDFGTAKHLNPSSINQSHTAAGTMVFMAPEVMRSEECTEAADIWSLGCLVVELVAGAYPYEEMSFQDPLQVVHHVAIHNKAPQYPKRLPPAGIAFLNRCFQAKPSARPTASQLLSDPFITQLEAEGSGPQLQATNPPRQPQPAQQPQQVSTFFESCSRSHEVTGPPAPSPAQPAKERHQDPTSAKPGAAPSGASVSVKNPTAASGKIPHAKPSKLLKRPTAKTGSTVSSTATSTKTAASSSSQHSLRTPPDRGVSPPPKATVAKK